MGICFNLELCPSDKTTGIITCQYKNGDMCGLKKHCDNNKNMTRLREHYNHKQMIKNALDE